MQGEPDQPRDGREGQGADALTIGLVIFFVSLIAIVAVLLVVPILTR